MINKVFLLGRLAGEPTFLRLGAATQGDDPGPSLEAVLRLTTFASRLTSEGDLGHDLQTVEVHVSGRVANLAQLVLEPGQLLWVEGRLEWVDRAALGRSNHDSGDSSAVPLRIVSTWFTILASAEASQHLEAFVAVDSGRGGVSPDPLRSRVGGAP